MRKVMGIAVLLAVMIILLSLVSPQFSKVGNIQNNITEYRCRI